MANDIIIVKPSENKYRIIKPSTKNIVIKPGTGGGGSKGIQFSVEDGHILVITGPVSVENNDTIVL